MLNFAIYGCGVISKTHAAALKDVQGAQLVACADFNPAAAEAFAHTNCIQMLPDWKALLESKDVAWDGQWKTFREMPWGEMYIKPYTGRVLTRAAFTLGPRVAAFRAAAEKMGATELKHGDAGYQFRLIGNYYMQIMVWEGDEEFPPNAQILYS